LKVGRSCCKLSSVADKRRFLTMTKKVRHPPEWRRRCPHLVCPPPICVSPCARDGCRAKGGSRHFNYHRCFISNRVENRKSGQTAARGPSEGAPRAEGPCTSTLHGCRTPPSSGSERSGVLQMLVFFIFILCRLKFLIEKCENWTEMRAPPLRQGATAAQKSAAHPHMHA